MTSAWWGWQARTAVRAGTAAAWGQAFAGPGSGSATMGRLARDRPGQHAECRPFPPPPGDLGLVDVPGSQHWVRPRDEVEHVTETVRSVNPPPVARLKAHAEARVGRLEGVDCRLGGAVRRAGGPEFLLVPQVHAGLVADLDRDGQVTEEPAPSLDD